MSAINNHYLAMSANSVTASMAPAQSATPAKASAKAMTANASAANTTGTGSSSGSADDPDDITSSDFLQLLVSELQNQDPTQPTDPDAYVQQLVGVNSLQQLISIDQELA
jgi:flagellar basal-body rod modification protein FlgD